MNNLSLPTIMQTPPPASLDTLSVLRFIAMLVSGVIIAGAVSVHAQVAARSPASANTAKDQDVVVLSPFEVISEEETGYVPTTDVSGTRLNTPIRDIAAPISVLTTELLNDIGALNISDAYEFMPNVTTNDLNADALEIDYVRPSWSSGLQRSTAGAAHSWSPAHWAAARGVE